MCWSDQLKLDLTITRIATMTRRGSEGRQMVARRLERFRPSIIFEIRKHF